MTAPPVGVAIRPFRPADRDQCAAVFVAARRLAFPWVPVETLALDDFDRDTADEEVSVAVGTDGAGGETVLGFVSIYRPGSFVHHLYVHPAHHRRGIGRRLLSHAVASLPPPCRLKCVIANTAAMAFYRAEGWVEEGHGEDLLGPHANLRFG